MLVPAGCRRSDARVKDAGPGSRPAACVRAPPKRRLRKLTSPNTYARPTDRRAAAELMIDLGAGRAAALT